MRVVQVRSAARCAVCHDALEGPAVRCVACDAQGHAECWADLGRCSTLGCASSTEFRTRTTRSARWWRRLIPLVLGSTVGAVALKDPPPPPRSLVSLLPEAVGFVSVLGWIVAVALANLGGQCGYDRAHRVAADMKAIGDALDLFRVDCGYYPESLDALWNRPANARKWGPQPYLKEYPPTDPWGNLYLYRPAEGGLELISRGADGRLGGADENQDLSSRTINER